MGPGCLLTETPLDPEYLLHRPPSAVHGKKKRVRMINSVLVLRPGGAGWICVSDFAFGGQADFYKRPLKCHSEKPELDASLIA